MGTTFRSFFYNVIHSGESNIISNPRRNNAFYSTVDYTFISNQIRPVFRSTDVHRLHSSCADRQLLSLSINLDRAPTGLELWRTNPILIQQKEFCFQLK